MYKERIYRKWVKSDDLVSFEVAVDETDLLVSAETDLTENARAAILTYRDDIKRYIERVRAFYDSLEPVEASADAPAIVKTMCRASKKAGVGPMAAVAGAIAEFVARDLVGLSKQVIVENGGDIFMMTSRKRTLGIYAGEGSPFTGKIAVEIAPRKNGIGACTSSGTVSHSLSFGNADAVLILSEEAALADAVATATGNSVKNAAKIEDGIQFAKSIDGVIGVLILIGNKMASWGEIKLV